MNACFFLKIYLFFFKFPCICLCLFATCLCKGPQRLEEGMRFRAAGAADGCEQVDMGVGNQNQVLSKNGSVCSLLSHLSRTQLLL